MKKNKLAKTALVASTLLSSCSIPTIKTPEKTPTDTVVKPTKPTEDKKTPEQIEAERKKQAEHKKFEAAAKYGALYDFYEKNTYAFNDSNLYKDGVKFQILDPSVKKITFAIADDLTEAINRNDSQSERYGFIKECLKLGINKFDDAIKSMDFEIKDQCDIDTTVDKNVIVLQFVHQFNVLPASEGLNHLIITGRYWGRYGSEHRYIGTDNKVMFEDIKEFNRIIIFDDLADTWWNDKTKTMYSYYLNNSYYKDVKSGKFELTTENSMLTCAVLHQLGTFFGLSDLTGNIETVMHSRAVDLKGKYGYSERYQTNTNNLSDLDIYNLQMMYDGEYTGTATKPKKTEKQIEQMYINEEQVRLDGYDYAIPMLKVLRNAPNSNSKEQESEQESEQELLSF